MLVLLLYQHHFLDYMKPENANRRLRQTTFSVGMTGAGRVDRAGCLRVDGRGRGDAAGALRVGRDESKREGRRRAEGKSELAQARRGHT